MSATGKGGGARSRPSGDPIGRIVAAVCAAVALMGGAVLIFLVGMSVVSIVGRKILAAPVPGDVEILQMGAAMASSAFFAHCHVRGQHVKVDFFTAVLPVRWVHALDAIGSVLVAAVGALVAARTWAGAMSVRDAGETSAILALPVWVTQALMVPGFALLAVAGVYMAAWHIRRMAEGTGASR